MAVGPVQEDTRRRSRLSTTYATVRPSPAIANEVTTSPGSSSAPRRETRKSVEPVQFSAGRRWFRQKDSRGRRNRRSPRAHRLPRSRRGVGDAITKADRAVELVVTREGHFVRRIDRQRAAAGLGKNRDGERVAIDVGVIRQDGQRSPLAASAGTRSKSSAANGASLTGFTVIASGRNVSVVALSAIPTMRVSAPLKFASGV